MVLSPTQAVLHGADGAHDTCSWSGAATSGAQATCVRSVSGTVAQTTTTQTMHAVAASVAPAPGRTRYWRWGAPVPDTIVPWIILPAVAGLIGIAVLVSLVARA